MWKRGYVFLSEAFAREFVGLEQREDGHWLAHLGRMNVGVLNERTRTALPLGSVGE